MSGWLSKRKKARKPFEKGFVVEAAGVELIHAIENMEVKDSVALGSPPRPPFLSMVSRFVTVVRLKHAEEKKL